MNISKSDFSLNDSDLEGILNDLSDDNAKHTKKEKENEENQSNTKISNSKISTTPKKGRRKRPPMQTKINLDELLEDIPLPQEMNLNPVITPKPSFSQTMTTLSPQVTKQPSSMQMSIINPFFVQVQHDLEEYIYSSFFTLRYQIIDFLNQLLEDDSKYQDTIDKFLKDIKQIIADEINLNINDSFQQQQIEQKTQQYVSDLTAQCYSSLEQFKSIFIGSSNKINQQQILNDQYYHGKNDFFAVTNANIQQKSKQLNDTSNTVS